MKSSELYDAATGTSFVLNGELWMRLEDSFDHSTFFVGMLVNLRTGQWKHCSELAND